MLLPQAEKCSGQQILLNRRLVPFEESLRSMVRKYYMFIHRRFMRCFPYAKILYISLLLINFAMDWPFQLGAISAMVLILSRALKGKLGINIKTMNYHRNNVQIITTNIIDFIQPIHHYCNYYTIVVTTTTFRTNNTSNKLHLFPFLAYGSKKA